MGELIWFQRHRVEKLFKTSPVVSVYVVNDGGDDVLMSHEIAAPGRAVRLDLGNLQGRELSITDEGIACMPTFGGRPSAVFVPWRCVLRSDPLSPPPQSGGTPGRQAA